MDTKNNSNWELTQWHVFQLMQALDKKELKTTFKRFRNWLDQPFIPQADYEQKLYNILTTLINKLNSQNNDKERIAKTLQKFNKNYFIQEGLPQNKIEAARKKLKKNLLNYFISNHIGLLNNHKKDKKKESLRNNLLLQELFTRKAQTGIFEDVFKNLQTIEDKRNSQQHWQHQAKSQYIKYYYYQSKIPGGQPATKFNEVWTSLQVSQFLNQLLHLLIYKDWADKIGGADEIKKVQLHFEETLNTISIFFKQQQDQSFPLLFLYKELSLFFIGLNKQEQLDAYNKHKKAFIQAEKYISDRGEKEIFIDKFIRFCLLQTFHFNRNSYNEELFFWYKYRDDAQLTIQNDNTVDLNVYISTIRSAYRVNEIPFAKQFYETYHSHFQQPIQKLIDESLHLSKILYKKDYKALEIALENLFDFFKTKELGKYNYIKITALKEVEQNEKKSWYNWYIALIKYFFYKGMDSEDFLQLGSKNFEILNALIPRMKENIRFGENNNSDIPLKEAYQNFFFIAEKIMNYIGEPLNRKKIRMQIEKQILADKPVVYPALLTEVTNYYFNKFIHTE